MGNTILILFAHPALEKSRVNRRLVDAVRSLDGVTFHDLYEAYPEFDVDVRREQQLLEEHAVVVLQHPLFWYSTPALVKQWEDLVLEHGWAYGASGTALAGKPVLNVVTTGGPERAYQKNHQGGFTLDDLLLPLRQTFLLCGMDYLPPFLVHGTHGMVDDEIGRHARDYRRVLEKLRDGALDLNDVRRHPRLNPPDEAGTA